MTNGRISFDKSFQITAHICATLVSPISVSVSVHDSVSVTFQSVEAPFFVIAVLQLILEQVTLLLSSALLLSLFSSTNEVLV
jgi:hypothetical protein